MARESWCLRLESTAQQIGCLLLKGFKARQRGIFLHEFNKSYDSLTMLSGRQEPLTESRLEKLEAASLYSSQQLDIFHRELERSSLEAQISRGI